MSNRIRKARYDNIKKLNESLNSKTLLREKPECTMDNNVGAQGGKNFVDCGHKNGAHTCNEFGECIKMGPGMVDTGRGGTDKYGSKDMTTKLNEAKQRLNEEAECDDENPCPEECGGQGSGAGSGGGWLGCECWGGYCIPNDPWNVGMTVNTGGDGGGNTKGKTKGKTTKLNEDCGCNGTKWR